MADLKASEIETAEFIFEVFGEDKKLDGTLLGKFMFCMNINPSQERLKTAGMTTKEGALAVQAVKMAIFQMTAPQKQVNLKIVVDARNLLKNGEKKFTLEEVLAVYAELKKEIKDFGCYEDFVECLKLYDKNENGYMQAGELNHSLLTLGILHNGLRGSKDHTGEKLTEAEVDELFETCLDEENDDGEIPYTPFLRRMCELDPPLKVSKK